MFSLSEQQQKKLQAWKKKLKPIETGAIGGEYTYHFTPTGVGTVVIVSRKPGEAIDLTDSDLW
jgi:hypothetical protein